MAAVKRDSLLVFTAGVRPQWLRSSEHQKKKKILIRCVWKIFFISGGPPRLQGHKPKNVADTLEAEEACPFS